MARVTYRRPIVPGNRVAQIAAIATVAAAGACTAAAPTGSAGIDRLWSAAIAASLARLAAGSRPGPLVVACSFAVASAPGPGPALAGLAGLAAAVGSTYVPGRLARATRGLGGGSAAVSLLLASSHDRGPVPATLAWLVVAGPVLASAVRHAVPAQRRRAAVGAAAVFSVLAGCCVLAGAGAVLARRQIDRGIDAFDRGTAAARAGDIAGARHQLDLASAAMDRAGDAASTWGFAARMVPGVAQNVRAVASVAHASGAAAGLAGTAAGLADGEALVVRGGVVDLRAVAALAGPLHRVAAGLASTASAIDGADRSPLLPPLRARLDALAPQVTRALDNARLGAAAAATVPRLLGADGPRRYLVLFTSPSEARGRFGFPGAYAVLDADAGRLTVEVTEPISRLQGNVPASQEHMPLTDPLVAPYVAFGVTRNWRNVTIPPDFPVVARLAGELWRQTGTGPLDGVLRFDTDALAALVALSGPVPVTGRTAPLTAADLAHYLDVEQYQQFGDSGTAARQEALQGVAGTVFRQLLAAGIPGPRGLSAALGPSVAAGHLQVSAFDPVSQAFLDLAGTTGRFEPTRTGDALAVAGVNGAASKIDAFLHRRIDYRATVARDGTIRATATIQLVNSAPARGLPAYVIGNALGPAGPPLGTNRTIAVIWSALPVASVTLDGAPAGVSSAKTPNWWVHTVSIDIPAGSTATLVVRLAGPAAAPGPYSLAVLPGGAATPDDLAVTVTDHRGHRVVSARTTLAGPVVLHP